MPHVPYDSKLLSAIVDRINVGVFVVDRDMRLLVWNYFMESHSGRPADEVVGHDLFEAFPELPKKWLERKIRSVFILRNFAFTSWEHRPYLFRFRHNRPITGDADYMHQSCTFQPILAQNGEVEAVCVSIFDVTDTSMYHNRLQATLAELREMSFCDELTGLFNRRHIEHHLRREFSRFKRYGSALSLLMFDVDEFKAINDVHGHLVGDEILREVAKRAQSCVRGTDFVGRYGGEEFVVVLTNTRCKGAMVLAERIRVAIGSNPVECDQAKVPVTVSVGVAEAEAATMQRHEALIQCADTALYESKRAGKNCVTIYDEHPNAANG